MNHELDFRGFPKIWEDTAIVDSNGTQRVGHQPATKKVTLWHDVGGCNHQNSVSKLYPRSRRVSITYWSYLFSLFAATSVFQDVFISICWRYHTPKQLFEALSRFKADASKCSPPKKERKKETTRRRCRQGTISSAGWGCRSCLPASGWHWIAWQGGWKLWHLWQLWIFHVS